MDIERFMDFIFSEISDGTASDFTEDEVAAITALRDEKYATHGWNWGTSPKYTYSNSVKLPSGLVEIFLNVEKGIIRECRICGDYFFTAPISELEELLVGTLNRYDDIFAAVSSIDINSYISGMTPEIMLLKHHARIGRIDKLCWQNYFHSSNFQKTNVHYHVLRLAILPRCSLFL